MSYWTSTYGLKGDPYAYLRLTVPGRLGIPLSGASRTGLQELKILNQFEKFGSQDKAIDFAKTLNQFDRGVINFVKNSKGQWVRAPKPGLGGYEFAKGGQQIELTKIRKVYDLDEIMPSDAQVDFENAGPELGELEAPPHPSMDYEDLELTDLTEEVVEQEAQEILTGLEKFTPLAEEALIEAETAEDTIILSTTNRNNCGGGRC